MHEGTRETWEQKIKKSACYICPILAEKLKCFGEGCWEERGQPAAICTAYLLRGPFMRETFTLIKLLS